MDRGADCSSSAGRCQRRGRKRKRVRGRMALAACCGAVPLEAYLVAGFFLASFCLFCFWLFFGDLSPIMVSFRRLLRDCSRPTSTRYKDYSTKSQVLAHRLSHC